MMTIAASMSDAAPEQAEINPEEDLTVDCAVDSSNPASRSALDPSSLPLSTAVRSDDTSPEVQTPNVPSTVSTLQLASEALSNIQDIQEQDRRVGSVPSEAADLLKAIHHRNKKVAAIRSPNPGSVRSRSAATTPVPPSLLFGIKHDSFDVTANSSRATTPTRTPSGRGKRRRRERNAATPTAVSSALPSIESNDRRRSARVAKTVTASASDSPNMPNLALFGFSPYLENLIMNAKETDRRTRSGGRGNRPLVDRAPMRGKRSAAKNKSKDSDPDGPSPDDEAKRDLYRQLCIISYQLQADLDMVPRKSLEQLEAQFATPPPDVKIAASGAASAIPGGSVNPSRAVTPSLPMTASQQPSQHQTSAFGTNGSTLLEPVIVKPEPPQSPQFSHVEPQQRKQDFSPESSPEVALAQTIRPSYGDQARYLLSYAQESDHFRHSPGPPPWTTKVDEREDEPMSPVYRPARSNIMSISALMSGPSPVKARSPTPEPYLTPPLPKSHLPWFMQEWTDEDEQATQILQACAAAIPKLDTTEFDRLTQIAQFAAFDLLMPPTSSSTQDSTSSLDQTDVERLEVLKKYDPTILNPLDSLNTQELYDREEAEYLEEIEASEDLYEVVHYLPSFDEVVDEWRAGELSRLRLQLEMRRAEIERIWTCDRKFAWSNFINDRAGELYRKAVMEVSHKRWQAEMELDLLTMHRRKTRGLAKLTQDNWVPDVEDLKEAKVAELYQRYGKFLSAAKYAGQEDPLVRADIRTMRKALREQKRREKQADHSKATVTAVAEGEPQGNEVSIVQAEGAEMVDGEVSAASSYESDSDEEYDSDSSYASSSSGISSLPSFSSVYSSPRLPSIAGDVAMSDVEGLASEVASLRDADMSSDAEADESLWARQIRLAKEAAVAAYPSFSANVSGVRTPAEPVEEVDGAASALPSRAASPGLSVKGLKQPNKKKRKKPPPPGARLWKKGRVQQDNEDAESQQKVPVHAPKEDYSREGKPQPMEEDQPTPEQTSRKGSSMVPMDPHFGLAERPEPQYYRNYTSTEHLPPPPPPATNMHSMGPYDYPMRPSYSSEYDYPDPYSMRNYAPSHHPGYGSFHQPPPPPASSLGYNGGAHSEHGPPPPPQDARYGRATPPPPVPDRYAHPPQPPTQQQQQQQQQHGSAYPPPPSQWPY